MAPSNIHFKCRTVGPTWYMRTLPGGSFQMWGGLGNS